MVGYHSRHLIRVGQVTPICDIGGAALAAFVHLMCSMRRSRRQTDFIGLAVLTEEAFGLLVAVLRSLPLRDTAKSQ